MTTTKYMGRGTQRFERHCDHGRFDGMCGERDCPHFGCAHGNGIDCGACKALKKSLHKHRLGSERVVAVWVLPVLAFLLCACSGESFVSEELRELDAQAGDSAVATSDAAENSDGEVNPDGGNRTTPGPDAASSHTDATPGDVSCCTDTCGDPVTQACVCGFDSYCCDQWDDVCGKQAPLCGLDCT